MEFPLKVYCNHYFVYVTCSLPNSHIFKGAYGICINKCQVNLKGRLGARSSGDMHSKNEIFGYLSLRILRIHPFIPYPWL